MLWYLVTRGGRGKGGRNSLKFQRFVLVARNLNSIRIKDWNPICTPTESGFELNKDCEGKKKEGEQYTL